MMMTTTTTTTMMMMMMMMIMIMMMIAMIKMYLLHCIMIAALYQKRSVAGQFATGYYSGFSG